MSIRILLIEDNPDHTLLTKKVLEKASREYEVDSANEVKEGLKRMFEDGYDLVLCDYRLPGLSALEILREMKEKGRDLPFVVVTASGNERAAVDLMREGAYDYVLKDLSYEETLPMVVKRSLERYHAKKEKEALEKKIEEAAEAWETTFNSITDMISIHDRDYKIMRVNKAFADAFKTSPDELIGKTCYEVIHCKKEPWPVCPHKQALETGQAIREEFFDFHLGVYLEVSASPIFNEEGKVVATVHIGKDITERKKAEDKIKVFSDAIASAFDCFMLTDTKGNITYANESALRVFGYTPEEFLKLNVTKLDADPMVAKKVMQELAAKGKWSGEVANIRKNKEIFSSLLSAFIVKDDKGNQRGTMGIIRDITERKKAEQALADAYKQLKETQQQLIQSAKMAATGQLVAGVSHELNQPLTGIKGFAQALLMDLEENSPARADLKKIVGQADRMDSIIKNLRLFARKSEFKTEELDINKPIQDALMLLSQQLKVHNIRLNTSLGENLPKIQGDSNQLQQAFLNLITNAEDAIDSLKHPDGGELIIKTALSEDNKYVEITFEDTGCGISPEDLENIFNPFFTTKFSMGGIGLGLSITYGIIENHRGKIEVKSQVGKGTIFRILLPTLEPAGNACISY